jgi:hypothetical protein
LIVGSAADTKVLRLVTATERPWVGMIEFEKRARLATTTIRRNVRAAQTISLENAPPNRVRDSTRAGVAPIVPAGFPSGLLLPRSLGSCESPFFEVCE